MSALARTVYGPDDSSAPTVVAVHGITASGRAWGAVAAQLPEVRIVAPDLRGRGRSRDLPAPYGLRRHAEDLEELVDELALDRPPLVVGHSMGAFCAVELAARIELPALVLVDGGMPLALPPGADREAVAAALLGPALSRLSTTFADRESYRAFWRRHPAFARDWNAAVEDYVAYDLIGEAPELRPATRPAAVAEDQPEVFGSARYEGLLRSLRIPVTLLRAPRGLQDEPEPLYPADRVAGFPELVPRFRVVEVDDVNHYTIVFAERGAAAVARELRALLPH